MITAETPISRLILNGQNVSFPLHKDTHAWPHYPGKLLAQLSTISLRGVSVRDVCQIFLLTFYFCSIGYGNFSSHVSVKCKPFLACL